MIRAGILITGTEVLSGAVSDRNGPWLARRLEQAGVEVAQIAIVGDRPEDMAAVLEPMAGLDLLITSGGLGPTADDLTVAAIAGWLDLELVLDGDLEAQIARIVSALRARRGIEGQAMDAGNRKQATIPAGATVIAPVGTAPGLVIRPDGPVRRPICVVLPGPPRELQPMWDSALATEPIQELLAAVEDRELQTMRLYGLPESQLAHTLREAQRAGIELERLQVTTCQHRGELEITTRVPAAERAAYAAFERFMEDAHPDQLFSRDGSTVEEQVARLLGDGGRTIALAESCTGGMLAARLTDLPGSSSYLKGGIVAYSNEVKTAQAGVPAELIERHGAVSEEVARALAEGVRSRLDSDLGVGVTGIAGPGGGSPEKPVGLVWLAIAGPAEETSTARSVRLPGGRAEVRERAVTVAMHMVRRALLTAGA